MGLKPAATPVHAPVAPPAAPATQPPVAGGFQNDDPFEDLLDAMDGDISVTGDGEDLFDNEAESGGAITQTQQVTAPQPGTPVQDRLAENVSSSSAPVFPEIGQTLASEGSDDVSVTTQTLAKIDLARNGLYFHIGISLLFSPNAYDPKNEVHRIIRMLRWGIDEQNRSVRVIDLEPRDIAHMGYVMSTHQVWVASLENQWTSQYELLGVELDRVMFAVRNKYPGDSKGEKESAALRADERLRNLRNKYLEAKAMKGLLAGMGAYFAQLENSLKRPADLRSDELTRSFHNRGISSR